MSSRRPPFELRLRVLAAIDYAEGESIQARIRSVAQQIFVDKQTGLSYQFTPRTISTWFYRMVRENNLLKESVNKKLRLSFAMRFANELWQADTMHGPKIKQPDGKWRKTLLIAFIDDASRVITGLCKA